MNKRSKRNPNDKPIIGAGRWGKFVGLEFASGTEAMDFFHFVGRVMMPDYHHRKYLPLPTLPKQMKGSRIFR